MVPCTASLRLIGGRSGFLTRRLRAKNAGAERHEAGSQSCQAAQPGETAEQIGYYDSEANDFGSGESGNN